MSGRSEGPTGLRREEDKETSGTDDGPRGWSSAGRFLPRLQDPRQTPSGTPDRGRPTGNPTPCPGTVPPSVFDTTTAGWVPVVRRLSGTLGTVGVVCETRRPLAGPPPSGPEDVLGTHTVTETSVVVVVAALVEGGSPPSPSSPPPPPPATSSPESPVGVNETGDGDGLGWFVPVGRRDKGVGEFETEKWDGEDQWSVSFLEVHTCPPTSSPSPVTS